MFLITTLNYRKIKECRGIVFTRVVDSSFHIVCAVIHIFYLFFTEIPKEWDTEGLTDPKNIFLVVVRYAYQYVRLN